MSPKNNLQTYVRHGNMTDTNKLISYIVSLFIHALSTIHIFFITAPGRTVHQANPDVIVVQQWLQFQGLSFVEI